MVIYRAAEENDLEAIMLYFFAGFEELNQVKDYEGRTIGHIAAFLGHVSIIVFLKNETNFNCFQVDNYGKTPADEAKTANHSNIEEILAVN